MVLAYRYLQLNSQGLSLLHQPPIVCLDSNKKKKNQSFQDMIPILGLLFNVTLFTKKTI